MYVEEIQKYKNKEKIKTYEKSKRGISQEY